MKLEDELQQTGKALADPSRFRMLQYIADADEPVAVSELTELLGFNHNAVRQHLAILVKSNLLVESDEVRSTRGRPRKLYRVREDAFDTFANVAGSYARLSELLLEVVRSGDTPYDVGYSAATEQQPVKPSGDDDALQNAKGQAAVLQLVETLAVQGFQPAVHKRGLIRLEHCPFADVAAKDPGVVCEIHRGLLDGQLSLTPGGSHADLEVRNPHRAGCLVSIISNDD